MDWLRLTPNAVGALIALLLAVAGVSYLLSLKNRSNQTRTLIVYLLLLAGMILTGFLQRSVLAPWQPWFFPFRLFFVMAAQTALLQFSYIFLAEPGRRRVAVVVLAAATLTVVTAIAMGVGVVTPGRIAPPVPLERLVTALLLVLTLAPPLVFFTRSISASRRALEKSRDRAGDRIAFRHAWSLIARPIGPEARGLRGFGLLTTLPLVLVANGLLAVYGILSIPVRDLIIVAIGSVYIFGFVVHYLSYARERSSVHAKLVGSALVAALLVLQVVSSILYTPERLVSGAGIRPLDGHAIHFRPLADGGYRVRHDRQIRPQDTAADSAVEVSPLEPVQLGFEFPFYGQTWRSVYVVESGFLAFGTTPRPERGFSTQAFVALEGTYSGSPKIMPLYAGLSLDRGGTMTYVKTTGAVVFTWRDVPQRHTARRSTFQVRLHSDGSIDFVYLDVGVALDTGAIGLTPGGERPAMVALDLFGTNGLDSPAGTGVVENLTLRYRHHAHRQLFPLVALIFATAGVILVGFPFFYRLVLTQPMQRLLDGLRRVDQGALDTQIDVGTEDELGAFAAHFNRMTASLRRSELVLKEHAAQLEQRVQERTEELAAQNLLLEEQSRRLLEIDEIKSRFFANLSHEFRTPLTLTIGPLEDLHSGLHGEQTAEVLEQLDLAIRNARRVLRLINQMLDIAKIEADQLSLRIQTTDLGQFLSDLGRAFVPLAERKHMHFDVDIPAQAVWVECDPSQLEKVFTNLLSNAFKFTPEGGAIRLAVQDPGASEDPDESVTVTIRDNGPGIQADQLEHVFERFYQADGTTPSLQAGTGIGLALAKELVELHDGRLTVDSEAGFGATFTVRLPASGDPVRAVQGEQTLDPTFEEARQQVWDLAAGSDLIQDTESETTHDDRTTVLVVDDNAEVRAYIRKHLVGQYRVVEAEDGAVALQTARSLLPDLVVSDVMMPNMDGSSLCRALKRDPELDYVPVILLTAKATEADKLDGLGLGADDYLSKPFSMPELAARIGNLIESRRRLKARYSRPIQLATTHVEVDSADQSFLQRLQGVIEEQLGDPEFSVERLAQAMGQSRGNLHRRVRALLDQTPTDLIRDLRLQRGADLLAQRAGSISEIAYTVGFKGVAHFSTSFRNKYGVPPSAYRVDA